MKLAFEGIGEIDFVAATALTDPAAVSKTVEGEALRLETVPEIITKKIYHRGASIKPRDIFDIAAGSETHAAEIVEALRPYRDSVRAAIISIDRLNPEFVTAAIKALAIKPEFRRLEDSAIQRAKSLLNSV